MPRPAGIGARLRANAPKQAPQKPSDMLISRTGLFYCATFPSKAGLPSSREPLASSDISVLAHIFLERLNYALHLLLSHPIMCCTL